MTQVSDLFSLDALDRCLADRTVVARKHPSKDLTILNYTERCQYERGLWNEVTLACRGLIHDSAGKVVARPFAKFFNYGDENAGQIAPDSPVIVTDKLDGSLGILYGYAGELEVATRGSFESEQARWATNWLRETYPDFVPHPGWTLCYEILYPENRIVVDYGERRELVLLGAVNIASGVSLDPWDTILMPWKGARADVFVAKTLADALTIAPRPNAEGIVIYLPSTNARLKVKQEDYVALHRIVTGLNERTVWTHLSEGKPLAEILDAIPDEFHGWVGEVAARLVGTVEAAAADVETAYSAILATLPEGYVKKDFAMVAKEHPRKSQLFSRHDGKDYRRQLWDECYPSPRNGPRGIAPSEESA